MIYILDIYPTVLNEILYKSNMQEKHRVFQNLKDENVRFELGI